MGPIPITKIVSSCWISWQADLSLHRIMTYLLIFYLSHAFNIFNIGWQYSVAMQSEISSGTSHFRLWSGVSIIHV